MQRQHDLDSHVADIPGCEKFPPIASQIRPDQFLVCLPLHIRLRVEKRVPLQFRNDVRQHTQIQFDTVVRLEDVGVTIFDFIEERRDPFLQ